MASGERPSDHDSRTAAVRQIQREGREGQGRTADAPGRGDGELTRVLYVINRIGFGGAEVGLCRLLDGLPDDDYEVTVVALDGVDEALAERLPDEVDVVDLRGVEGLAEVRDLVAATVEADVVVGSLYHSVLVARLVGALRRDARVVTWLHNEEFKTTFRRRLFERTSPLCDAVLADSEPVAELLREDIAVPEEAVTTVPIAGISPEDYQVREHRETESVVVGSVGRVTEIKNYQSVIRMAERLADDGIEFRIAGEGPRRRALQTCADERDLHNLRFLGRVPDVAEFLSTVDVYVQPSLREGLCITVVEAMAAGLPVVGSEVGGIARNVREGENGYLHDPHDVEGFCESVRELADDPARRRRFGEAGRELVERNYTQDVLVEGFERAIRG